MKEEIENGMSDTQAISAIKAGADFAVTLASGGVPKTTYWTPDGTMIKQNTQMRDYVRKDKDGKVIGQGKRDANLDNGWLVQKPIVLIPRCLRCGMWHATQAEDEVCRIQQGKKDEQLGRIVEADIKTELSSKDNKIIELEKKIEALTKLVEKSLGGATSDAFLTK